MAGFKLPAFLSQMFLQENGNPSQPHPHEDAEQTESSRQLESLEQKNFIVQEAAHKTPHLQNSQQQQQQQQIQVQDFHADDGFLSAPN